MKTDSIFYRLFQTFPQSFFDLLNLPEESINHYQFSSVEVKQLSFRVDGVFLPNNFNEPIYFVEVQFQKDERFYSRFFSEIFLYLHQSNVENDWRGVIIYPNLSVESRNISRYRELINSDKVNRFYLNQLSNIESIGINLLKLTVEPQYKAIEQGKQLIQQVRQQYRDAHQQQAILELIETILIYKLPKMNRKEIEAMFSLSDLRETRVYQEAIEQGIEQGIERGIEQGRMQEKIDSIPRLLALGLNIDQIAQALDLPTQQVEQILKQT